jgi:predicted nucleic acid-binding protein
VDRLTTSARENKVQIISLQWAINETVKVLDGLQRKKEITRMELQRAIFMMVERVANSSKDSNFRFAEVSNQIVIISSYLIPEFHISADDALHFATALSYGCKAFVLDDRSFKNKIKVQRRIIIYGLRDKDDMEGLTLLCGLD